MFRVAALPMLTVPCKRPRIAREEIFGPVLVAIPWRDEADAIRLANDSHYGLAAYVWTHDIGSALRTRSSRVGCR